MKQLYPVLGFVAFAAICFVGMKYQDKVESETVLYFIIAVIISAIASFLLFPELFIENTKKQAAEKFLKTIDKLLDQKPANLNDIFVVGERYQLNHKEIEELMLKAFTEQIQSEGTSGNSNLLKQKIEELKLNEPFANLPEPIRIYLLQIYNSPNTNQELVRLLAASISDFIIKAERQNKKERWKSTFGVILGIIGLVLSIYYGVNAK